MDRCDRILEVYEANGSEMSTLRLAQACIREGVFDEVDLNNASVRWAQDSVRKALKAKLLLNGVPYAGPTPKLDDDGGRVWKQYSLWDYEDAEYILTDRVKGLMCDYRPIVAMHADMLRRWGKAPEIPQLVAK